MEYEGLSAKIAEYIADRAKAKKKEGDEKYKPDVWLTNAAKRAKQIKFVTHALKFSHQDAKGTSINSNETSINNSNKRYFLTSQMVSNPQIDMVGNAAALDVGKLLILEYNGKKLIDWIKEDNLSPLKPFANTDKQLLEWGKGFKDVLNISNPVAHLLSKQIYFFIKKDKYHLLSPLFNSSLCHKIDDRLRNVRYSEQMKDARKAKRDNRYSEIEVVSFPDVAVQTFGGTKPQNISQLNSVRGGKAYLLSCQPPKWKKVDKPPLSARTVFSYKYLGRRVFSIMKELRDFLESHLNRKNNIRIRNYREKQVDKVIDELFQYGAEIQNMRSHAGWSCSKECNLPVEEQLWLDPYRCLNDVEFAEKRESKKWCEEVAKSFSRWFNKTIETKHLKMGDAEYTEWKSIVERKFALIKDDLEVME